MAINLDDKIDGAPIDAALDRRRPGRRDDVHPELIPVLRTTGNGVFLPPEDLDDADPLATSRGISLGVIISAVVWTLIGLAAWFLW